MKIQIRLFVLLGVFAAAGFGVTTLDAQATFTPIGDLSGGVLSSQVRAVDEDGGVAVGSGSASNSAPGGGNGDRPVYYTAGGGLVELPSSVTVTAGAVFMTASDITPDGSIVVGPERDNATNFSPRQAAVWTNNGTTLQTLGTLPGATSQFSAAAAVSDNGSVVYGFSADSAGKFQAFRWTSGTGMVGLGFLNGSDTSSTVAGRGTSGDGTIAVGSSGTSTFGPGSVAFRYVLNSGMSSLGLLSGGTWSAAAAITTDGSKVFGVGDSSANSNGELFMWTASGGMVGLGAPADDSGTNLMGVSSDGKVVTFDTYIYNASGFHSVGSLLTGASLNITGWSNMTAFGVSDNGNVLWGQGIDPAGNTEGWSATFPTGYLAAIPEPSTYGAFAGLAVLGLAAGKCRRHRAS